MYDFLKNFSEYRITKVPNEKKSDLTQIINAVRDRLDESKKLPRETPVHVLTRLTQFSVTEFVRNFELMINTEHIRHMESDGATVSYKRTLERVENITLISNNYFQYLNVFKSWNIIRRYNNILGPCYNYDAEDRIVPNFLVSCYAENKKREMRHVKPLVETLVIK